MTLLGDVSDASERVRKLEAQLFEARERQRRFILKAHKEGISVARIARAAQLSRQRVSELVHRPSRGK